MAITGATAMDLEFFKKHGLEKSIWNSAPLGTQIQWFQQLMPSICGSGAELPVRCNDYNAPIFDGRAMAEVTSYVPQIVDRITSGVEVRVRRAAREKRKQQLAAALTYVVADADRAGRGGRGGSWRGVLPIGCFPVYLTLYPGRNKGDYDDTGCLKTYNDLASHHNELLKQAVSGLRSKHAGVRLMYADLYAQVADMVRSPETFAHAVAVVFSLVYVYCVHTQPAFKLKLYVCIHRSSGLKYGLRVCCGADGQGSYNYNNGARCGDSGSGACGDPENYLVWDGIHLTDAAYRSIADGWLDGAYCSPGILH
ncbi:LOW QUALITY PROTEIN: hypothetical protein U9M48_021194 [Paspalum notatum var. saurae]|uniref:GDSL esterase/lipase n=1 Tax=Paspalum notatum var. saurae TaxID=547442 RepID=A0AAQ3TIK4_PASNO